MTTPPPGPTTLATPPQEPATMETSTNDAVIVDGQQPLPAEAEENPVSTVTSNGKRKSRTTRAAEEGSKRVKLSSQSKDYTPPSIRPSDIGGADASIDTMRELVIMPLKHPEVYLHIGVQPARGILLHGPPGCGKTLLANAIAGVSVSVAYNTTLLA